MHKLWNNNKRIRITPQITPSKKEPGLLFSFHLPLLTASQAPRQKIPKKLSRIIIGLGGEEEFDKVLFKFGRIKRRRSNEERIKYLFLLNQSYWLTDQS
jgi:hypothetical protein